MLMCCDSGRQGITASPGCAFLLKGGNDMKGKLFKKVLAVATSVLMLAGGASVQPFSDIFEDMAITASAADTITVTFNTAGGLPVPETQTVESGGKLTKPDQDPVKEGCTFEGWYIQKHKVEQVDDTIDIFTYFEELDFDTDTITSSTIVCAKWSRPAETVSFMDSDGSTKTVDAVPLDGQERLIGDGWYVVNQDINYTNTLDISGDVNIILSDNHKMTFGSEGEWFANNSIYTSSRGALSFYAQSEGENAGELCFEKKSDDNSGMGIFSAFISELNIYGGKYNLSQGINAGDINITAGTFNCTNADSAIVATNKLNISGGDLYIKTSRYGIICPDINISGGNFYIKSGINGIYSDNKKKGTPVTITGGTFKIPGNGSDHAGEFAGLLATGDIKILGGQYDDLGEETGLYARGIIYFGYENIDDFIKISSWAGYVFSFNAGLPGASNAIILLKPFVIEGSDTAANVSYYGNNIKNNKIVPKTQTVTVTAKDTENNNINSSAAGSHTVVYGGTLTLTAPDVDGYIFRGWYEGDTLLTSESECTTNEITKDTAITALYETVSANTASAVFGTPINGLYTLESKTYVLNEDIYTVGRIYVPKGVTAYIDLNGHTIDRGLGSYKDGGGVFGVADGATLSISDGTIKGGRRGSGNGGGFNVNGELILNSVIIEDCKAEHAGGGIYINGLNGNTASVIMRGKSIVKNNTAGTYGSGIYVGENANLTIEGKPVVIYNARTNVYLTEGRKISFMGELDPGTEVGITYIDEGKSGFTSEYSSYINNADPSEYFFGDNGDEVVLNSGEARLAKEYIKRSWNSTTKKVEEETLYADTFIPFSEVTVTEDDTVDLTDNQWYVLTKDTLLSHKVRVFVGANILLCDGKELTCKSGIVVENGNTLNIYGQAKDSGKLISNGGEKCAGIGGDDDNSKDTVGNIRIFGGTISATSEKYGAGIGGGKETGGGTIEIYGGTVTAKGGKFGAGIGGGYDNPKVGNILIMGGRVTASSTELGAGIGCSDSSVHDKMKAEGSVTVSGGYVKVFAKAGSAGIGSSRMNDANMDITITGGTVIVESEEFSDAGIGTGVCGDFTGTIRITGGTVIANGGKQSPGIGAALQGNMEGSIFITGGDVTAVGKCGAAAIGAGVRNEWDGGHCTGTISITGGTVRLKNEDSEEKPSLYIGHGYDGEKDGTLNIGSDMKVQLRNADDTAGEDVPQSDWIKACRTEHTDNRFLYIMSAEKFEDGIGEQLYGNSLSLEGDIGVNFYMMLADDIASSETAYMQFTTPAGSKTETKTVLVKDAAKKVINGKTYYVFKCNVSAKDMASEIKAQIIDGDKAGTTYTYSVKDYADYLLEHNEVEEYAKAAPLVKKMLNYGAASQTYFGIEGTAANAELDDADKALGKVSIPYSFKYSDNATLPEGVTFEGATLSLKSETTLSLYFKGLPVDTKFTCDGKTVETAKNGEYVVARIRGISSNELEGNFTVTFTGGSVTYNAMTYCYNVLNGGTDDKNLQNVCKALYLYAEEARKYFGGNN